MKIKVFNTENERFEYFNVILTSEEEKQYKNDANIEEILTQREVTK